MNKLSFEQQLATQLEQIDSHKLPERDLWVGIERALVDQAEPKASSHAPRYLLAASVLLCITVGWLSFNPLGQPQQGRDLVAQLSQQHLQQKNALLVQFKDQPALTQNWQQQLQELDEAEAAIKTALQNDPNNMALLKLLQGVYQQQINLIERVHAPKWSQI